jgi:ribosomal protein L4
MTCFGIDQQAVNAQALLRQLANARLGTHKAKGDVFRKCVVGGRKALAAKKGTGRAPARVAVRAAQVWKGGGIIFVAPRPVAMRKR